MRRRRDIDREDAGFTLIELLVVIIIIGILAAIAIPVFLSQRTKGYDASAQSDIKALADHQEFYMVDHQVYTTIASMRAAGQDVRATGGVTVTVVRFNGPNSYCLSARHQGSSRTYYWDSAAGGLQPPGTPGCPVTTVGTAGDALTG